MVVLSRISLLAQRRRISSRPVVWLCLRSPAAAARGGEAEAQRNRVLHGRTKAEKQRDRLERERAQKRAEQARLEPDEG